MVGTSQRVHPLTLSITAPPTLPRSSCNGVNRARLVLFGQPGLAVFETLQDTMFWFVFVRYLNHAGYLLWDI